MENQIYNIRATVTPRDTNPHNGGKIKPEVQLIQGKTFDFKFGWVMNDTDPYPDEVAWIPDSENWPEMAPIWIASGDLDIEEKKL